MLIDTINVSTAGEQESNGKRRVCYLDLFLCDTGQMK